MWCSAKTVLDLALFFLLKADGMCSLSSGFKRVYLCRYKPVFYVLYIPGIVGQHINIFLISRDGQFQFYALKQSMKSVQQQAIFRKIQFSSLTRFQHIFHIVNDLLVIPAATVSFLKVFSKYETQNQPRSTDFSTFCKNGQNQFLTCQNHFPSF